eukprot:TRINITY_DN15176_c0_g2_i1.p1 TRINITY_DN15176_c0_g2~~TRINITY_DN15176_c0_g2_i1.p1  ORF type:complete len:1951 (+),score=609.22 TRINITY_DN15176_c0_g2_i1:72-5855(+)
MGAAACAQRCAAARRSYGPGDAPESAESSEGSQSGSTGSTSSPCPSYGSAALTPALLGTDQSPVTPLHADGAKESGRAGSSALKSSGVQSASRGHSGRRTPIRDGALSEWSALTDVQRCATEAAISESQAEQRRLREELQGEQRRYAAMVQAHRLEIRDLDETIRKLRAQQAPRDSARISTGGAAEEWMYCLPDSLLGDYVTAPSAYAECEKVDDAPAPSPRKYKRSFCILQKEQQRSEHRRSSAMSSSISAAAGEQQGGRTAAGQSAAGTAAGSHVTRSPSNVSSLLEPPPQPPPPQPPPPQPPPPQPPPPQQQQEDPWLGPAPAPPVQRYGAARGPPPRAGTAQVLECEHVPLPPGRISFNDRRTSNRISIAATPHGLVYSVNGTPRPVVSALHWAAAPALAIRFPELPTAKCPEGRSVLPPVAGLTALLQQLAELAEYSGVAHNITAPTSSPSGPSPQSPDGSSPLGRTRSTRQASAAPTPPSDSPSGVTPRRKKQFRDEGTQTSEYGPSAPASSPRILGLGASSRLSGLQGLMLSVSTPVCPPGPRMLRTEGSFSRPTQLTCSSRSPLPIQHDHSPVNYSACIGTAGPLAALVSEARQLAPPSAFDLGAESGTLHRVERLLEECPAQQTTNAEQLQQLTATVGALRAEGALLTRHLMLAEHRAAVAAEEIQAIKHALSETRIDPRDGHRYTELEFIQCYGGVAEWVQAQAPGGSEEPGTYSSAKLCAALVAAEHAAERALLEGAAAVAAAEQQAAADRRARTEAEAQKGSAERAAHALRQALRTLLAERCSCCGKAPAQLRSPELATPSVRSLGGQNSSPPAQDSSGAPREASVSSPAALDVPSGKEASESARRAEELHGARRLEQLHAMQAEVAALNCALRRAVDATNGGHRTLSEVRQDGLNGPMRRSQVLRCFNLSRAPPPRGCGNLVAGPQQRRLDSSDGLAYTKEEFAAAYGRLDEWEAAAPTVPGRILLRAAVCLSAQRARAGARCVLTQSVLRTLTTTWMRWSARLLHRWIGAARGGSSWRELSAETVEHDALAQAEPAAEQLRLELSATQRELSDVRAAAASAAAQHAAALAVQQAVADAAAGRAERFAADLAVAEREAAAAAEELRRAQEAAAQADDAQRLASERAASEGQRAAAAETELRAAELRAAALSERLRQAEQAERLAVALRAQLGAAQRAAAAAEQRAGAEAEAAAEQREALQAAADAAAERGSRLAERLHEAEAAAAAAGAAAELAASAAAARERESEQRIAQLAAQLRAAQQQAEAAELQGGALSERLRQAEARQGAAEADRAAAEERLRQAEGRAGAAELGRTAAEELRQAEARAGAADAQCAAAAERLRAAEHRAAAAEAREAAAAAQLSAAQDAAAAAATQCSAAGERAEELAERLRAAQERAEDAEGRAAELAQQLRAAEQRSEGVPVLASIASLAPSAEPDAGAPGARYQLRSPEAGEHNEAVPRAPAVGFFDLPTDEQKRTSRPGARSSGGATCHAPGHSVRSSESGPAEVTGLRRRVSELEAALAASLHRRSQSGTDGPDGRIARTDSGFATRQHSAMTHSVWNMPSASEVGRNPDLPTSPGAPVAYALQLLGGHQGRLLGAGLLDLLVLARHPAPDETMPQAPLLVHSSASGSLPNHSRSGTPMSGPHAQRTCSSLPPPIGHDTATRRCLLSREALAAALGAARSTAARGAALLRLAAAALRSHGRRPELRQAESSRCSHREGAPPAVLLGAESSLSSPRAPQPQPQMPPQLRGLVTSCRSPLREPQLQKREAELERRVAELAAAGHWARQELEAWMGVGAGVKGSGGAAELSAALRAAVEAQSAAAAERQRCAQLRKVLRAATTELQMWRAQAPERAQQQAPLLAYPLDHTIDSDMMRPESGNFHAPTPPPYPAAAGGPPRGWRDPPPRPLTAPPR